MCINYGSVLQICFRHPQNFTYPNHFGYHSQSVSFNLIHLCMSTSTCQALIENMCILPVGRIRNIETVWTEAFTLKWGMLAAVLTVNDCLHLAIETFWKNIPH